MYVVNFNQVVTMSSREIAELTGKDHDNVRRDIKILAEALSLNIEEKLEGSSGGRPFKVFHLAKRETLILISGYSVSVRARIIDRWQELEMQQAPALPNFSDPVAAARAWADAKEAEQEAVNRLEQAKPAIEFAARHAGAGNLLSIRGTAKALKFSEGLFIAAMIRDGLLYREKSTGNLMPYADKQHGGMFDVITGEANGHAYLQTKVTALGVQKLAARYSSELSQ